MFRDKFHDKVVSASFESCKTQDGASQTENEEIKSRWKEYCEDMYKCSEDMEEELGADLTEDLKVESQ